MAELRPSSPLRSIYVYLPRVESGAISVSRSFNQTMGGSLNPEACPQMLLYLWSTTTNNVVSLFNPVSFLTCLLLIVKAKF